MDSFLLFNRHRTDCSIPRCCWTFLLLLFISSPSAFSDAITTQDGSVLKGTIIRLMEGKLSMQTTFAGELSIAMEQIALMAFDNPKSIHLDDGRVLQGTMVAKNSHHMELVQKQGKENIPITLDQIKAIDPPPPPPAKWHGKVVGNFAMAAGNSETIGTGLSADLNRRTEHHRIALRSGYFYSDDNGKGIRDDQFMFGKYDYFFNKQWFGYLTTRIDRDAIRDLDLRTTGGAGAGYQWLETDTLNLFGEMGTSYVKEDFGNDADDQTYIAGRVSLHFDWWILKDTLQFTENMEWFLGLEDIKEWFAISDSSITWKWNARWSSQASVRFEYDNTPSSGFDRIDTKYTLGIGYSF